MRGCEERVDLERLTVRFKLVNARRPMRVDAQGFAYVRSQAKALWMFRPTTYMYNREQLRKEHAMSQETITSLGVTVSILVAIVTLLIYSRSRRDSEIKSLNNEVSNLKVAVKGIETMIDIKFDRLEKMIQGLKNAQK